MSSHLIAEVRTLPDVARGLLVGALLDTRAALLWIARHV